MSASERPDERPAKRPAKRPASKRRPARRPESGLPADFAATERARRLIELVDSGAPVISISGRAGTGKTTLMRFLVARDDVPQVILAPTGVAALHAGGQTIHSFFLLPPRILDNEALSQKRSRTLWRKVERIIIDEISMVRADVLDAIDTRLRRARRNRKPFGGVQVVLVGDYLQLAPVVPGREGEILGQMGYENGYAFSSRVMGEVEPAQLRLETVYRQTDERFIALLARLRSGATRREAIDELNAQCFGAHRAGATPMILTPTNDAADHYNGAALEALAGDSEVYHGTVAGDFGIASERLPAPEELALKVGARVRALKNGPELRWVNGSLGEVVELHDNQAEVQFDHLTDPVRIEAETWEKVAYEWDAAKKQVLATVAGTYSQVPLALAWASTIHKAQGLTLEDVRIDIGYGAFASGQAYVAVSRARALEGLSLERPLEPSDFFVDPAVLRHEQAMAARVAAV